MARIAFIQYLWHRQLGVMSVSAALKRGGHGTMVAVGKPRAMARRLIAFRPDILAFSCITGMQPWVSGTIRRLRQALGRPVLSLVGGPHPTFFPEMIEDPGIDIVCLGEGDHAVVELAQALDRGEDWGGIQGLWSKRNGDIVRNERRPLIGDLDALPWPDHGIYDSIPFIRSAGRSPFMSTRGCPFRCSFCYNHVLRKLSQPGTPYVRRRNAADVIEELKALKRDRAPRALIASDDHFTFAPTEWLEEFLTWYRDEVAIPYFACARADSVTPGLVKLLKASGCYSVAIGVESGDERMRNSLLQKDITDSQIWEAVRLLREHGVPFVTTNMMCLPGETMDQALSTIRLNARLRPAATWCFLYQPYPLTELGEHCFERGLAERSDAVAPALSSYTCSRLRQPGIDALVNLHKFSLVAIRFPWLLPLVRKLIRLPPNALFRAFYLVSYLLLNHRPSLRLSWRRVVREAWVAARHYH